MYGQLSYDEELESILEWSLDNCNLDLAKAIDTLEYVENFCKTNGDDKNLAKVYKNFAKVFISEFHSFKQANSYVEQIKELAQKNDNPILLAEYHNTLGECYHYEKTHLEKAFKEFEKARKVLLANNLPVNYSILNNVGLHYLELNQPDSALVYMYNSLRSFNEDKKNTSSRFLVKNNLNTGLCHIYLNQLDSTEYYFKQALVIAEDRENTTQILESHIYLGIFYQETGRPTEALDQLFEGENYINSSSSIHDKSLLYEGISLCYEALDSFELAYKYQLIHNSYNDSIDILGLNEQVFSIEFLQQLDSLENEKQIILLEKEITDQKRSFENKMFKSRIIRISLIGLILFLVLIFVLYRINKSRKFNQIAVEKERLEKEQIQKSSEIEILKKENALLIADAKMTMQENEVEGIKEQLKEHIDKSTDPEFNKLKLYLKQLKNSDKSKDQLKHVDAVLESSEGQFFKLLRKKHPNLSSEDIKLCALLRLNISTKELASIFNISDSSLRTKKYRLKKKIDIDKDMSLENYIANLSS